MDKNKCTSCGEAPKQCSCKNKDFTKAVVEINNPGCTTLIRKVVVPASMGDDTAFPPVIGKYHNVLLNYEIGNKSYLYSSDGIPTLLNNGVTDYEEAINLPQINGVTLLGDKSSADLKLADAPMVITVADGNAHWSGADTAEDVYNFFLNKGKVSIVFEGGENYAYEIDSAAYISEEEKMLCTLSVATMTTVEETTEFDGNALFGIMTLYTADKAIDVSQIELQPKLFVTDFTGLDLNYNELSGVPATEFSIGMVKPGDGLEVDSDGVLSVSDIEQYAHFFDTVADMKASTELKDGTFAKTAGFYTENDGGSAFYKVREKGASETPDERFVIAIGNDLVGELITGEMVNVLQVGGGNNFSSVCNDLLNAGKSIYIPKGSYTADSSIIVNQPNTTFICDGDITLGGTSSVLLSIRSSYNQIKFNGYMYAGDNDAIHVCDGANSAYSNRVFVHRIVNSRNGIVINPNTTIGAQTSDFEFTWISATQCGIYFNPGDDGRPWINACRFRGGVISAPCGIKSRKGANQTDSFNDNSFNQIAYTNVSDCALDLQGMYNSYFKENRMSEGLTGTYWIKLDACAGNLFENEFILNLSKINISNPSGLFMRNKFIANDITNSGGDYVGTYAYSIGDNFVVPRDSLVRPDMRYLNGTEGVWSDLPEFYYDGMTVVVGTYDSTARTMELTLPSAFCKQGIKDFVLKINRQFVDTTIVLKDVNGQSIPITNPSSTINDQFYRVFLLQDGNGYLVWKKEKIDIV